MNALSRELLALGFRPKRRFGQNFLLDANFLDFMVREADLAPDDAVVEFGTGPGHLTELLAARVAKVFTIEVDPRLHEFAKGRAGAPNVEFHLGDAIPGGDDLNADFVRRVLAGAPGRRLRVVSNFPYAVGGAILLALAEGQLPAADALGTLQAEVADRLAAGPSDGEYGPLGILVRRRARVKRVRDVRRNLFWPVPRVDSTLVNVTFAPGATPLEARSLGFDENWPSYKSFVKLAFSQRRKTLGAGLRKLGLRYDGPMAARRPEELTPGELEAVWREAK